MSWEILLVLAVLVITFALMVWEKLSLDLVAMRVFSPRPFIIAVALGASACFATPIGYQTNTLVDGAGGYRFADFIKVGLPPNLIFCARAATIIPKLWPF